MNDDIWSRGPVVGGGEVKGMFHAWYIAIIVATVATAIVVLDAAPLLAGCGTSGC